MVYQSRSSAISRAAGCSQAREIGGASCSAAQTLRKIELGPGVQNIVATDGQRAVYWDAAETTLSLAMWLERAGIGVDRDWL
jgi:hypothetical protein